ncbi:MAG: DMT family transporter [Acetobacteraceae bacterium]|jgi:drug/metabolite transporter (DMT)-like permease|nr:DMT family transporter [Acetobacteraceae bacterium]
MTAALPRPSPPVARAHLHAAALLAAACLFWAGNFVLGRAAAGEVPPVGLAFWRWVLAGAVLAPFAARPIWAARAEIMGRAGLFLALGIFGVGSFNTLTYIALTRTEAINAALTNSLIPVAIIIAALLLDREKPARVQLAGLALSLAGVTVIVARGDAATLAGFRINSGDVLMLAAVIAWGLYTVLLRRVPAGLRASLGPMGLLGATIVFGLPVIGLCRVLELQLGGLAMPTDATSLALIAYTALFASIASYLCWNGGVALIGPASAGPYLHLMPPFSAALAVPLLGEAVRPFHAVGLLLIVAGVALAGRR